MTTFYLFIYFYFLFLDEHGATTDVMRLMMDVYNLAVKVLFALITYHFA